MTEKFLEYLAVAEKKLKLADHMAYVTYPMIKEKRLLFRILTEVYESVLSNINSILHYEYLYKRVRLTGNARDNLLIFAQKCSEKYALNEGDVKEVMELIDLMKKHKESPFEFARGDKIVIMSEDLKTESVDLERVKRFLNLEKKLLQGSKKIILQNSNNF